MSKQIAKNLNKIVELVLPVVDSLAIEISCGGYFGTHNLAQVIQVDSCVPSHVFHVNDCTTSCATL